MEWASPEEVEAMYRSRAWASLKAWLEHRRESCHQTWENLDQSVNPGEFERLQGECRLVKEICNSGTETTVKRFAIENAKENRQ